MKFKNPINEYTEVGYSLSSFIFCLFFGPFYFLVKGIYKHALFSFFAAFFSLGLSLWIYPIFLKKIIIKWYANRGWIQITDELQVPSYKDEQNLGSIEKVILAGVLFCAVGFSLFFYKNTPRRVALPQTEMSATAQSQKMCDSTGKVKLIGTDDQCKSIISVVDGLNKLGWVKDGDAIPAMRLIADYKANEARADLKYKNKAIFVEGIIGTISKDFTNAIYINLTNPYSYGLENVHAELGPVHLTHPDLTKDNVILTTEEKAVKFNKGNKISLSCIGSGAMMNMPVLKKCMIQ